MSRGRQLLTLIQLVGIVMTIQDSFSMIVLCFPHGQDVPFLYTFEAERKKYKLLLFTFIGKASLQSHWLE